MVKQGRSRTFEIEWRFRALEAVRAWGRYCKSCDTM
jgi:hypothetical protein